MLKYRADYYWESKIRKNINSNYACLTGRKVKITGKIKSLNQFIMKTIVLIVNLLGILANLRSTYV
jgi:hypothetical protein